MPLRLDTKSKIKFIPDCEKGEANPTTFYVTPPNYRDSLIRKNLFQFKGKVEVSSGDEKFLDGEMIRADQDEYINWMAGRIDRIENVVGADGSLITVRGHKNIIEALSSPNMSIQMGRELYVYLDKDKSLDEDQLKN